MSPGWMAELFKDSYRNLVRHKVRSMLTLLGVIFGVASVITMLALGEGAQRGVLAEIEGLGLKNIIVESVRPAFSASAEGGDSRILDYGLTHKDVEQIRSAYPTVDIALTHFIKDKVYYQSRALEAEARGITANYFGYMDCSILHGRLLSEIHSRHNHKVAVVSEEAALRMGGVKSAVGKTIKIGRYYFDVVGVVRMPTQRSGGLVMIPWFTSQTVFGGLSVRGDQGSIDFTRTEVGGLLLNAKSEKEILVLGRLIQRTLERNHPRHDFKITIPLDILRSKQKAQRILNFVLIAIAAISLVVGGIGIMNIMLAVVVERIPEIGIRRALGANQHDIFLQFVCETLTLSSLGGVLGCLLGMGLVPVAALWTGWSGVITPGSVILSIVVSWCVGVIFGTVPALRASRLDPCEALRRE